MFAKFYKFFKKTDLRIKSDKNKFYVQSVQFLEFIIMFQRFKINFKKIKTVTSWFTSKIKIEIQFFLKFANFYRKFIKKYFKIVSLFTNFIKKNISFVWTEKTKNAFRKLKKLFISQSVLIIFKLKKFITFETNALNEIIKACIN